MAAAENEAAAAASKVVVGKSTVQRAYDEAIKNLEREPFPPYER